MKRKSRFLTLIMAVILILPTMTFPSLAEGGAYNLKWSAADPALNKGSYAPTYPKWQPSDVAWPISGRQDNPLPDAVAYGPNFTSSDFDAVSSLMPKNLALGQIVPFELEIKVSGDTAPENGIITIEPYWLTKTTSGDDFGFDPAYKIIAAFVDIGDVGTVDPGLNASVTAFSSTISHAGTSNETIDGKITVSGLDSGDNVIVEIWVVLKKTLTEKPTGNIQTGIDKAYTASSDNISVGNQTVPLLQSGDFFTDDADLSITKSDSPDPIVEGQNVTYSITVTNHSTDTVANGIVVTDTLDPNVSFVSASDGGTHTSGVVTWPAFSLVPGGVETLSVVVTVNSSAPTGNFLGSGADTRGGITSPATGSFDINNKVEVIAITDDPTISNNVYYQPTNVVIQENPALNIVKVTVFGDLSGDGLSIPAGSAIKWRYTITNIGNIPLSGISVTDNMAGITPAYVSGDTGADGILGLAEIWIYEASGTAVVGAYANTGTADSTESGPDTDPSSYFGTTTGIAINKVTVFGPTSGDGLNIPAGSAINWRYTVTNTGNLPLTGITVTDNKPGVVPAYVSGDMNTDGKLDPTETWIYEASGIAIAGVYSNTGTADSTETEPATDTSNYFGEDPKLSINKVTVHGDQSGDGISIPVGSAIKWHYTITNTGNIPLSGITVSDNKPGVSPVYVSGDLNTNGKLDLTEVWIFEASGIAVAGVYSNIGTADSTESGSASDTSSYFGTDTKLSVVKVTVYGNQSGDGINIPAGSAIKWRYSVTNTGNVPLSGITVQDNMAGVTPVYVSGDANSDGKLDVSETWIYEASGIAIAGAYSNTGTADSSETGPASDTSNYFGENPRIAINKVTVYGQTAGDGLSILEGSAIKWRYTVTNAGNLSLSSITVTDNKGVVPVYISGDLNNNGILEVTETWIYEVAGIAQYGLYSNIGTADSLQSGPATDASNYTGYRNSPPPPPPPPPPEPLYGSINLFKFLDSDRDGVKDTAEFPMNAITFGLYDTNKNPITTKTTDVNGNLSFINLSFGTYYLREINSEFIITTGNFDLGGFSNPITINSTTPFSFVVGNERIVVPQPEPIVEEVVEEEIPLATPLPQTGEIPPYFAYGFGSLLILAGLYLKRKF